MLSQLLFTLFRIYDNKITTLFYIIMLPIIILMTLVIFSDNNGNENTLLSAGLKITFGSLLTPTAITVFISYTDIEDVSSINTNLYILSITAIFLMFDGIRDLYNLLDISRISEKSDLYKINTSNVEYYIKNNYRKAILKRIINRYIYIYFVLGVSFSFISVLIYSVYNKSTYTIGLLIPTMGVLIWSYIWNLYYLKNISKVIKELTNNNLSDIYEYEYWNELIRMPKIKAFLISKFPIIVLAIGLAFALYIEVFLQLYYVIKNNIGLPYGLQRTILIENIGYMYSNSQLIKYGMLPSLILLILFIVERNLFKKKVL